MRLRLKVIHLLASELSTVNLRLDISQATVGEDIVP